MTLVRQLAESRQRLQDLREQRNEEVRARFCLGGIAERRFRAVPEWLAALGSSL